MKVFLSSTFLDLRDERLAVLNALEKRHTSGLAMEYFLATSTTPAETALAELRNADVMILVIAFQAGSLLPDESGQTYTRAEYEELIRCGKEALVFIKQERGLSGEQARWKNKETMPKRNRR